MMELEEVRVAAVTERVTEAMRLNYSHLFLTLSFARLRVVYEVSLLLYASDFPPWGSFRRRVT
jgi:hypothetical protein